MKAEHRTEIQKMFLAGDSVHQIVRTTGLSNATIQRAVRDVRQTPEELRRCLLERRVPSGPEGWQTLNMIVLEAMAESDHRAAPAAREALNAFYAGLEAGKSTGNAILDAVQSFQNARDLWKASRKVRNGRGE